MVKMNSQLISSIKTSVFLLLVSFLLVQCTAKMPSGGKLEQEFKNPSIENRPLAFYDWLNGYVDTVKLVYELEEMKRQGMRGAFIWDVGALADPGKMIPAGPAFLGEQSLKTIALALKTAGRLGLEMGMIASSSWNAGGDWIGEADASKQLLSTTQMVEGPSKKKILINKPESHAGGARACSWITSVAVPHSDSKKIDYTGANAVSLDEFTTAGQSVEWKVPKGKWDIISFFMCNTGQSLECPSPNSIGPMIDHLSSRATKIHFDTIITRLDRINTPQNRLKFLEVDSYEVWPAKDWTPGLIQEFKARYNYDPAPFLPLLQGYSSEDSIVGERFLGDYNRLVGDLIVENHFMQATELSNANGMKLFAEAGHGGYPRVEPLKGLGNSDVPMGEFWNRQRFWVTREAASAAHIYGKQVVASESLTGWNHWQHGPADYKQLIDIAFCQGLNQIVFHTFAHNPEIAGKPGFAYHAGEHLNVNTTWWDMARPFMDYLSRCSYLLRQGNFVADACLYYGDQAPNLVPPKRIDPNIKPIYNDDQCLHCGQPKPVNVGALHGHDYDYINADVITTTLRVEAGNLVLPSGISYRVMLLPDRAAISLEVLKSLEKLVSDGATVIGPRPDRTTSLAGYPGCDDEVKAIAAKLWGQADGEKVFSNIYGKGKVYWGKSVKQVLEEMNVGPDLEIQGIDNSQYIIDFIHRRTETEDIYFVSNSSPDAQKITCTFRVSSDWVPELWDAETGLIQRKVVHEKTGSGIRIELMMDPLASRFVVFRDRSTGKNDPGLGTDLQFGFSGSADKTERIDITDKWKVSFNPGMGGPTAFQMDRLTSWPDVDSTGVKYYSGTATYSREFTVDEGMLAKKPAVYVDFDDIQETARVIINGQNNGIIWTPPYRANITGHLKPGTNEIKVEVINNWNNRIVGDHRNPDGPAYTRTNVKHKFNAKSALLPSGLIGKAEIVITWSTRN
jgi:hypothetical protein